MVPRFQLSLRAHVTADCRGHSHGTLGKASLHHSAEPRQANPSAMPAEEGVVGKAAQRQVKKAA